MSKIHTHYDNLKVSQDATPNEIRAAYRSLSKKYHPDYNKSPDAIKIMQLINRAYKVLSNPEERRKHDLWIAAQKNTQDIEQLPVIYEAIPQAWEEHKRFISKKIIALIILSIIAVIAIITLSVNLLSNKISPKSKDNTLYTIYATTPLGTSWPVNAGYIQACTNNNQDNSYCYPLLKNSGSLKISVRNPHQKSAIFAYLYDAIEEGQGALRTFFIPSQEAFSLEQLPQGQYHIKYMRLDNGQWYQTEAIELSQNHKLTLNTADVLADDIIELTDE